MISFSRLGRGIKYPGLAASILNKQYHTRFGRLEYNPRGINIFDQDWDNLVILDACRYDEFLRCANLSGETEVKVSRGSASKEFIKGNFGNRDLRDTAYISANTWYGRLEEQLNADLFLYHLVERDVLNGLTSSPESVTNEAFDVAEEYQNKRLVIHYMQPHRPYLGPRGREIFDPYQPFVDMVSEADVTRKQLRECYRENLQLVLDSVDELLARLTGKTVITSDHGELLGEREYPLPFRHFGHPDGVYIETLTKVPWHVIPAETRRDIQKDQPVETEHDAAEVEEHLKDLGYLSP